MVWVAVEAEVTVVAEPVPWTGETSVELELAGATGEDSAGEDSAGEEPVWVTAWLVT